MSQCVPSKICGSFNGYSIPGKIILKNKINLKRKAASQKRNKGISKTDCKAFLSSILVIHVTFKSLKNCWNWWYRRVSWIDLIIWHLYDMESKNRPQRMEAVCKSGEPEANQYRSDCAGDKVRELRWCDNALVNQRNKAILRFLEFRNYEVHRSKMEERFCVGYCLKSPVNYRKIYNKIAQSGSCVAKFKCPDAGSERH